MDTIEAIKTRRSIRKYGDADVEKEKIDLILDSCRWAPSGHNNQPWRFIVIRDKKVIEEVAKCTIYGKILRSAKVLIAVFLDSSAMYDKKKDTLAMGACIQNMLLAANSLGLGACWQGEILNQKDIVNKILGAPDTLELMAVVTLGYPVEKVGSIRKGVAEIAHMDRYGNKY